MFRKLLTTRSLCVSAIIAALYAAATLLLAPISYGAIQCRLSEALTLLPMLLPQAIPGLFVGCLVSNLLSPMGMNVLDIIFGSWRRSWLPWARTASAPGRCWPPPAPSWPMR